MSPVSPETTRLGWIGTGVMGAAMAERLLDAGYALTVYNRTPAKAEPLTAKGATLAENPRAVAENSDVTITIVGYPHDVRAVVLGEDGALAGAAAGSILVDMTTSAPALAVEIAEAAAAKGVQSLDAPVSGGDVGAKSGALSIMCGGDADVFHALAPLFDVLGKTVVLQGGSGAGQHTKMVNQTLIASNMIGVCEALVYADRAGLDLETVLKSVSGGAAGSWSLSNLAPRMLKGDFAPGFYVEHFLKDLGLALSEADRMHLCLPGLALARQLYNAVAAAGGGRDGTQALVRVVADLSGRRWGE
ncbi:NAD(P)-dependent oxidoreductase [Alienimonas californiensis]|uniref:2-hydroxy-3-oxopropionate reductase n=1 Tax=Alienimonas californiensis TaxID=2527989 RepID=A0A517P5R0_9PLAN|nr:NAD(P)-dependent oxidoreductase [Alienimonas californiensis]QDT14704.1 2-hydroxy-3-oxopropionate reductase [Alienimonas californiensis]